MKSCCRMAPAELDDEAVVAIAHAGAVTQRRFDVASRERALVRGVLRCHRRDLARPGQVGHWPS